MTLVLRYLSDETSELYKLRRGKLNFLKTGPIDGLLSKKPRLVILSNENFVSSSIKIDNLNFTPDADQFLFSETQSRILVSVKKNQLANFKKIFKTSNYTIIGKCTGSDVIEFKDNKKIIRGKISDFAKSYKQNIKGL